MNKISFIVAIAGCMVSCLATAPTTRADAVRNFALAEDGGPDQTRGSAAVPADNTVQALLQQVLRQVTHGQTAAPEGDNAIATWKSLLSVVIPPSPAAAKAMTDFVRDARQRAAEEQAAGRTMTAMDLSLFAAEATDILRGQRLAPEGSPDAAADTTAGAPTPGQDAQEAPSSRAQETPPPSNPVRDAPADDNSAGKLALRSEAPGPAPSAGESGSAALAPALPPAAPPRTAAQQAAAAAAVNRGDAMMAMKDISAARGFYAYAANAGDARAAAALAETYDPVVLRRLNVIGPKPDPALAAEWYRRASALGDRSAEARIQTLQAEAAK